ncbi:sialidase family protein [Hoylesella enoeca]|uniref:sialidase family protein n=1 Tax=Hoylesella enoeca TaxID=76123 RepID=UPI000686E66B|nr:sialidase family protein [Hoylesella enoeca]
MKLTATLLLSVTLFSVLPSHATGQYKQRLFETKKTDTIPYRIPAIATCSNGDLIAVSDYRYCGADIGFGPVDLHYRISHDNGRTWGPEKLLADGNGTAKNNTWNYAFGDCAIVADRNSNEVLVVCVAGKRPYSRSTRKNPCRAACFRSHDNGQTWDKGMEITEQIYSLFDSRKAGPIRSLFVGSGKIHQSRYVKTGKYYRFMLHSVRFQATLSFSATTSATRGKCWVASTNRVVPMAMNLNAKSSLMEVSY